MPKAEQKGRFLRMEIKATEMPPRPWIRWNEEAVREALRRNGFDMAREIGREKRRTGAEVFVQEIVKAKQGAAAA